jgi:hypothetical protein
MKAQIQLGVLLALLLSCQVPAQFPTVDLILPRFGGHGV